MISALVEENPRQVTVMLADDHPVVRQALRNEIEKETDLSVIAEAGDGEQAVRLATELTPDVVLMDIGMPRLNGLEATKQIKANHPQTIVLVLTVHDDTEHILGILKAGADGYLTKNVLVRDIIRSIRSLIAGETVLSREVYQQVLKYAVRYVTKPLRIDPGINLTPRELEILRLTGKGLSNKEIAQELHIGIRTVKSHVVDIFSKLKVCSRTEAVITGLRAGVFTLNDLE